MSYSSYVRGGPAKVFHKGIFLWAKSTRRQKPMKTNNQVPEFHSLLPGVFLYMALTLMMVKYINPLANDPDLPRMQILAEIMFVALHLRKNEGKLFFCHLTGIITLVLLGLEQPTVNSTWIWTCIGLAASTKVFELGLLRFAKQRRRTTAP